MSDLRITSLENQREWLTEQLQKAAADLYAAKAENARLREERDAALVAEAMHGPLVDECCEQSKWIETLKAENARLREALQSIRNELGVPQPGYLAPVANASEIARQALAGAEGDGG